MAEIVGVVSSIYALVELGGTALSKSYGYWSKVRDASARVQMIQVEVDLTDEHLVRLRSQLATSRKGFLTHHLAKIDDRTLEQCSTDIKALKSLLIRCRIDGKRGCVLMLKKLIWPVREIRAANILERVRLVRGLVTEIHTADASMAIAEADKRHLLAWLCPLNVNTEEQYELALAARAPGSGEWLLSSEEFMEWKNGGLRCVWLTGLPGSGKTVLAAVATEHLRRLRVSAAGYGANIAVVCYFFDYKNPNLTPISSFIESFIRQLLGQDPTGFQDAYEFQQFKSTVGPTLGDQVLLIASLMKRFHRVFIVTDSIETCQDGSSAVLAVLGRLLACTDKSSVRMLFASRGLPTIKSELDKLCRYRTLVSNEKNHNDIHDFVKLAVNNLPIIRHLELNADERGDIRDMLLEKANGLCTSAKDLKATLQALPCHLNETFAQMFAEVLRKNQEPKERQYLLKMAQWLCESNHCLPVSELAAFLSVESGDSEVDCDAIHYNPNALAERFPGLITFDPNVMPGEAAFSHFAIEAYLHSPECESNPDVNALFVDRIAAQRMITETCLQYLSFADFDTPLLTSEKGNTFKYLPGGLGIPFEATDHSCALGERVRAFEGFYYSSHNWPEHFHRAKYTRAEYGRRIKPLFSWFLHNRSMGGQYQSWQEAHAFYCTSNTCDCDHWQPPIYYAVVFGLEHVVEDLLNHYPKERIDEVMPGGYTLREVATRNHQPLVSQLLVNSGAKRLPSDNAVGRQPFSVKADIPLLALPKIPGGSKPCRRRRTCEICQTNFSTTNRSLSSINVAAECLGCVNRRWDSHTSRSDRVRPFKMRFEFNGA